MISWNGWFIGEDFSREYLLFETRCKLKRDVLIITGCAVSWAPEGIIRRLPWTYPEFDTLIKELSPTEDIKVQKGRHVFDWDADLKTLRRVSEKEVD